MSKLTRKVKLPKEESNDNENRGRDPKDEPSSTPDRNEDKAEFPELFAKSNERFFYDEKEETIWKMQERLTTMKGKYNVPKKRSKSKKTTKLKRSRESPKPYLQPQVQI